MLSEHSKKLANHSANFSGLIKFLITYLVLRRSTSRVITNSSSVGITNTLTADSAVVISPTCPKTFFSGSTSIPNQVRPSKTEARTSAEFSPIPAVKTIASVSVQHTEVLSNVFTQTIPHKDHKPRATFFHRQHSYQQ